MAKGSPPPACVHLVPRAKLPGLQPVMDVAPPGPAYYQFFKPAPQLDLVPKRKPYKEPSAKKLAKLTSKAALDMMRPDLPIRLHCPACGRPVRPSRRRGALASFCPDCRAARDGNDWPVLGARRYVETRPANPSIAWPPSGPAQPVTSPASLADYMADVRIAEANEEDPRWRRWDARVGVLRDSLLRDRRNLKGRHVRMARSPEGTGFDSNDKLSPLKWLGGVPKLTKLVGHAGKPGRPSFKGPEDKPSKLRREYLWRKRQRPAAISLVDWEILRLTEVELVKAPQIAKLPAYAGLTTAAIRQRVARARGVLLIGQAPALAASS